MELVYQYTFPEAMKYYLEKGGESKNLLSKMAALETITEVNACGKNSAEYRHALRIIEEKKVASMVLGKLSPKLKFLFRAHFQNLNGKSHPYTSSSVSKRNKLADLDAYFINMLKISFDSFFVNEFLANSSNSLNIKETIGLMINILLLGITTCTKYINLG